MSHLSKCIKTKTEFLTEDEKATLNSIGQTINEPIVTKQQLQLKINIVHCKNDNTKEIVLFVKLNLLTNTGIEDTIAAEICFISVRRVCAIGTQRYAIGDVFEKTNDSISVHDEGMDTLRLQQIDSNCEKKCQRQYA